MLQDSKKLGKFQRRRKRKTKTKKKKLKAVWAACSQFAARSYASQLRIVENKWLIPLLTNQRMQERIGSFNASTP